MILSDEDPFWVKYRHSFFGDPLQSHQQELTRWMQQGDFAEIIQLEQNGASGNNDGPSLNKMALHNMSEYTYGKERVYHHFFFFITHTYTNSYSFLIIIIHQFSNHQLLLTQLDKYGRAHTSNDAAALQNDMLISAITKRKVERKDLLSRLVPLLQDSNVRFVNIYTYVHMYTHIYSFRYFIHKQRIWCCL